MDPYIGEIRLFTSYYAPKGWLMCQGQTLNIQQYNTLFSVIGFRYGGDGKSTFALPNLSGRAAIGQGHGDGLTPRKIASQVGEDETKLTVDQIPNHTHVPRGSDVSTLSVADPTNAVWGAKSPGPPSSKIYATNVQVPFNSMVLNSTGGDQAHNNMQPYLALNFIIAYEGVFPVKG